LNRKHKIPLFLLFMLLLPATWASQDPAPGGTPCPTLSGAATLPAQQPGPTCAEPPRYELFFSPHTHHWTHSEEHRQVLALSVSRLLPRDRFYGLSLFTNSFGQPSAYAFVGQTWPNLLRALPGVYGSLSAGILYGYVDEYQDKVPFNLGGFSPAVIPAIGYRITPRTSVEVHLLGTAALMVGGSWRF
jgi:hypothetical protein